MAPGLKQATLKVSGGRNVEISSQAASPSKSPLRTQPMRHAYPGAPVDETDMVTDGQEISSGDEQDPQLGELSEGERESSDEGEEAVVAPGSRKRLSSQIRKFAEIQVSDTEEEDGELCSQSPRRHSVNDNQGSTSAGPSSSRNKSNPTTTSHSHSPPKSVTNGPSTPRPSQTLNRWQRATSSFIGVEIPPLSPKSNHSRSASKASPTKRSQVLVLDDETTEEEEEVVTPKKKLGSSAQKKRIVLSEDEADDESVEAITPAQKKMDKGKRRAISSDEDEDNDDRPAFRPVAKKGAPKAKAVKSKEAVVISDKSSDDDDALMELDDIVAQSKNLAQSAKRRHLSISSADSESPPPPRKSTASTSKSTKQLTQKKKASVKSTSARKKSPVKKRQRRARSSDEASENSDIHDFIASEDDDMLGRPSTSKAKQQPRKKNKKRRRRRSFVNYSDDEDDLELSGKETMLKDRMRKRSKESKFDALRRMREEKAGGRSSSQVPHIEIDSSSSSTSGDSDSDSDSQLGNFIESDDGNDLMVQEHREAVNARAQGFKYHLKTFCQYLIFEIVVPNVEWLDDEESFEIAFKSVQGDINSFLSALIGSSAWRVPFQKAIDRRPNMSLADQDMLSRGGPCDACTMGKARHSALEATFSGDRYHPETFLPRNDDSDLSSDEESSDEEGHNDVKDGTQVFRLGKSCAGRGEVYHEFKHWGWETRRELERLVEPELPEYQPSKLHIDPSASAKKRKEAAREVKIKWQIKQAIRIHALLEDRKKIGRIADMYMSRKNDAQQAFATSK